MVYNQITSAVEQLPGYPAWVAHGKASLSLVTSMVALADKVEMAAGSVCARYMSVGMALCADAGRLRKEADSVRERCHV